MAVLPESMDRLNVDDSRSALSVIENYIRYMSERIEFSFSNLTKNISDAGVSSATLYIMLVALTNQLSAIQSTVNSNSAQLTEISASINTLNTEISALKDRVSALENGA